MTDVSLTKPVGLAAAALLRSNNGRAKPVASKEPICRKLRRGKKRSYKFMGMPWKAAF